MGYVEIDVRPGKLRYTPITIRQEEILFHEDYEQQYLEGTVVDPNSDNPRYLENMFHPIHYQTCIGTWTPRTWTRDELRERCRERRHQLRPGTLRQDTMHRARI